MYVQNGQKSKTRHFLMQSRQVRKWKDDEKMAIKYLCVFARGFWLSDKSGLVWLRAPR
jgi:hypothetical protein